MLKTIFIFLLVIFSLTTYGQNYQNICSPGKTFFRSSTAIDSGFRPDSVKVESGDSVFYTYHIFKRIDSLQGYYDSTCGSIFGLKIVKYPDGSFIFFNRNQDSILLKASCTLNQAWQMVSLANHGYIEARMTDKTLENFLGVNDSVKVITLQAKDSTGAPIPHPLNDSVIKLSKSYGLIRFYDVNDFPEKNYMRYLAGKSSPPIGFQDVTQKEIYDWPEGAVFHYKLEWGPWHPSCEYTIKTITKKTLFSDSVSYSCHICKWNIDYYPPCDSTYQEQDQTEVYRFIPEDEYYSRMPYEYNVTHYNYYGNLYNISISPINHEVTKTISEDDLCRFSPYWSERYGPPFITKVFTNHLGMTSLSDYEWTDVCENIGLVYYHDATLTWGTPIPYAGCPYIENKNKGIVIISPNPVTDEATITLSAVNMSSSHPYSFCIYNAFGKRVLCLPVSSSTFRFNRTGLASGIYIYMLQDPNGKMTANGKIIVE